MKNIILQLIFGIIVSLFIFPAGIASAQMMEGSMMSVGTDGDVNNNAHESLDVVLSEILEKYEKNKVQDLDCDDLSEEDLERIGDAVMESIHPGGIHERMDAMMGGEGSKTLEQAHINMGRNYLGCNSNGIGNGSGMMGFNTVMPMMAGSAWTNFGAGNWVHLIWIINSLLISVLLIVLIRYFWKKKRGGG